MTNKDTTPTGGAADLRTAAQAVVDRWDTPLWKDVPATAEYIGRLRAALAAGQATAAKPAAPPNAIIASVVRDDGGEAPAFCLMAAYRSEKDAMDALALIAAAPAQPAAQQGVAYAALPDEREAFESWLRSVWTAGYGCPKCDSGKYVHGEAQRFWECWQARASHGQAPATQQDPAGWYVTGCSRLLDEDDAKAEARHIGGTARAIPLYTEPKPSPTAPPAPPADSVQGDAARYRWLAEHCRSTSEHWGGRWSIIIDGPAPKSHDSEDDFDAAIDAARKQGANHDR